MAIYKNVNCMFFCKDNNNQLKGGKFKSVAVKQSGSISFAIKELELQFLVDEKVLIDTIKQSAEIETEGVWTRFTDKGILPIKCMININSMLGTTTFNVSGIKQFIGIKDEILKEILNI